MQHQVAHVFVWDKKKSNKLHTVEMKFKENNNDNNY
jgi:hypothetical protein